MKNQFEKRELNAYILYLVNRLQIFMQIYIFTNTSKDIELGQTFVSSTKYSNEYFRYFTFEFVKNYKISSILILLKPTIPWNKCRLETISKRNELNLKEDSVWRNSGIFSIIELTISWNSVWKRCGNAEWQLMVIFINPIRSWSFLV